MKKIFCAFAFLSLLLLSNPLLAQACDSCASEVIEIGPVSLTPTGPTGGPLPHDSPGIPINIDNFLDCPFGRTIYHPEIDIIINNTCNGCGGDYAERKRIHYVEGEDGQIVPGGQDEHIRGRKPVPLPGSPKRTIDPGAPIPGDPTGDYRGIPRQIGEHNCGTALLCYLLGILGLEDTIDFMLEADEALRRDKGPCHRIAWGVVDPNVVGDILGSCMAVR